MFKHWSDDLLIVLITLSLCLSLSNDIASQFVQFADACTPQWSNRLYFLHGLIVGSLTLLLPLATRAFSGLTFALLMRFFPCNQSEEVDL